MDAITVKKNILNDNLLDELKAYLNNCIFEYSNDNERIYLKSKKDDKYLEKLFSTLFDSNDVTLKKVESFTIKPSTSESFHFGEECENGVIIDLQIVQNGKNYPLIGNTETYEKDFFNVVFKHLLVYVFIKDINVDVDSETNKKISDFIYTYNFKDTCYNVDLFVCLLLENIKMYYSIEHLIECIEHFESSFKIIFEAIKSDENGLKYHPDIMNIFKGYNTNKKDKYLHDCLVGIEIEKLNTMSGYSYLQFALPNEPVLYNLPLIDNQCVIFPSSIIHKREPYERFTDDKIIHIVFTCSK